MSLQGPIVVVAERAAPALVQALGAAGAFPIVETGWADAADAIDRIKPAAVVLAEPRADDGAAALAQRIASAKPYLPMVARVVAGAPLAMAGAIAVAPETPFERLIARLSGAQRLRTLHATVLRRAATLESERGIIAEAPAGDPLDDATVLVVGRGRSYPALTVAVGERVGIMGALSVEAAARCLNAREIEGIAIGEGLPARSLAAFCQVLAEDGRFRELPIGTLGERAIFEALPNFLCGPDPVALAERLMPVVRLRAFENRLRRLLKSIESKGMLDARTGLLLAEAFERDLARAVAEAGDRGTSLSIARIALEQMADPRSSIDAARLIGRLIRNGDFACRRDDGSIVTVFTETDLRHAHVAARRLASVLKHTMLRPGQAHAESPSVTLAALKASDTAATLMARVAAAPVATASLRA